MLRLNELYEDASRKENKEEVSTDFFDIEGIFGWVRDAFALKGVFTDGEQRVDEEKQE